MTTSVETTELFASLPRAIPAPAIATVRFYGIDDEVEQGWVALDLVALMTEHAELWRDGPIAPDGKSLAEAISDFVTECVSKPHLWIFDEAVVLASVDDRDELLTDDDLGFEVIVDDVAVRKVLAFELAAVERSAVDELALIVAAG